MIGDRILDISSSGHLESMTVTSKRYSMKTSSSDAGVRWTRIN